MTRLFLNLKLSQIIKYCDYSCTHTPWQNISKNFIVSFRDFHVVVITWYGKNYCFAKTEHVPEQRSVSLLSFACLPKKSSHYYSLFSDSSAGEPTLGVGAISFMELPLRCVATEWMRYGMAPCTTDASLPACASNSNASPPPGALTSVGVSWKN